MLTQAKATQRAMALNLMFEELARESLEENEASGGAHADAAAEAATLGVFRRETGDTDAFVRDAAALDDSTDAPLATPARTDADLTPAATSATTPGGMSNRNVSFDDESAAAAPDDPANDTSETDGDSQLTPGPRVMRFLTTAGERSIAFVVDKVFADDEYYRPAARKSRRSVPASCYLLQKDIASISTLQTIIQERSSSPSRALGRRRYEPESHAALKLVVRRVHKHLVALWLEAAKRRAVRPSARKPIRLDSPWRSVAAPPRAPRG